MAKRIIIGAVLYDNTAVLVQFLRALSLIDPSEHKIGFAFVEVRLSAVSQLLVRTFLNRHPGFVESHYVQKEMLQAIPYAHRSDWHFALSRNRLIQEAVNSKADALLLLDMACPPRPSTLNELLSTEKPWVDKLVFEGEMPLASPHIAQDFSEIDPQSFTDIHLCLIASAGSCMLLQKEALGPTLRYHYFEKLGLYRPDQHLASRAMLMDMPRVLDCHHPLHRGAEQPPLPGSLAWLAEGVRELLSYTPESTGLEGLPYLCQSLREQRLSEAELLAAEIKSAQIHSNVHIVSIAPDPDLEGSFAILAVQELRSGELQEHNAIHIHLMTAYESDQRWIQGIDISALLEAELPNIHPTKKQRYAIPPLQSSFQTASNNETQRIDAAEAKRLLKAVRGLQIYRLPH